MRVTDRGIFEAARITNAAARERHARATDRAATGVALKHPWDGPGAAQVAAEVFSMSRAKAIATTAARVRDEVDMMDKSFGAVIEAVTDGVELAVRMANDSFNAEDRRRAGSDARRLVDDVVRALNVEINGRYLFAGDLDDQIPFDATGDYVGDDATHVIETAPGQTQTVNVSAARAVKGAGGGVDVPAVLGALATALEADDLVGVRAALGALQTAISQVGAAQAEAGGISLGLDIAESSMLSQGDAAQVRRSAFTDADFVEAATELALADHALEAAFAATAKSFQLTLLDKI